MKFPLLVGLVQRIGGRRGKGRCRRARRGLPAGLAHLHVQHFDEPVQGLCTQRHGAMAFLGKGKTDQPASVVAALSTGDADDQFGHGPRSQFRRLVAPLGPHLRLRRHRLMVCLRDRRACDRVQPFGHLRRVLDHHVQVASPLGGDSTREMDPMLGLLGDQAQEDAILDGS